MLASRTVASMAANKKGLNKEERTQRASAAATTRWENERKRKEALAAAAPTSFDPPQAHVVSVPPPIHPLGTEIRPDPQLPPAPAPEPPRRPKKPRMAKEFGVAHSYAEKRLAEAIKERAVAMGRVAMLNAEIPSLVQIIKALGNTPDLSGMQDFAAQMPGAYQMPGMDPAMMIPNMPPIPIARGGSMGVIQDGGGPVVNENMFLEGDTMTSGGGWR